MERMSGESSRGLPRKTSKQMIYTGENDSDEELDEFIEESYPLNDAASAAADNER